MENNYIAKYIIDQVNPLLSVRALQFKLIYYLTQGFMLQIQRFGAL